MRAISTGASAPSLVHRAEDTRTSRPSLAFLVGWAAFAVLVAYVVFVGGGRNGVLAGELRVANLAIIAVAMVTWTVLMLRAPARWRPRSAIWPALLLPLLALAVTTITSPFPRLGLEYVAWAILLVALYLLLVRILAQPEARARIGGLAAMLALVIGIAYVGSAVANWLEWWELVGRTTELMLRPGHVGLPFGGPTVVAPVMILMAAAAFAGLGFASRGRQALLAILAVLTVVVVLLTGTRAAWLAGSLSLVAVAMVLAFRHRGRAMMLLSDRRVRIGLVGAVIACVALGVVFAPQVLDRVTNTGDGGRVLYLSIAARMFEDAPLAGLGPGNWSAQRIAYTAAGEPDIYVHAAHNVYVQTLAETGLLGMVAGLGALLAIGWLIARALRDRSADRRRYAWVAVFVLGYLGIHSLFDSFLDVPVVYLLAALPIALLDTTSRTVIGEGVARRMRLDRGRLAWAPAVLLGIAVVGAVVILWRVEAAAATHERAITAVRTADWDDAAEPARAAIAEDPEMPAYQVTHGLVASAVGDWERAEAAFLAAARVDDLPQTWLNVALARFESGADETAVVEAIERGLRIGSQHPSVQLAAGHLYDRLGRSEDADAAYAAVIAAMPSIAADTDGWGALVSPGRFDAVVDGAIASSDRPWLLAAMAGRPNDALALARDAADPGLAALMIDAWDGDAEATAAIQSRSLANPSDRDLAGLVSIISARAGEDEAAAQFRDVANYGSEATFLLGYRAWIDAPGADVPADAVRLVNPWAVMAYRRGSVGEVLAPGLPTIVLT